MSPEFLLELIPTTVIVLWLLQKLIDLAKVSKYGPALSELLKALNDGKIDHDEFEAMKAKL